MSDGELEHEVQAYVESVVANAPVSSQRLSEIRTATQQDGELLQIIAFIRNGWPPKSRMLPSLQPYFSARAHLSETDGLVLYQDMIVIPVALRSAILEQIHGGHQGLTRCRARARMSVWWPRISGEITQKVSACRFCVENRPSFGSVFSAAGATTHRSPTRGPMAAHCSRPLRTGKEELPCGDGLLLKGP